MIASFVRVQPTTPSSANSFAEAPLLPYLRSAFIVKRTLIRYTLSNYHKQKPPKRIPELSTGFVTIHPAVQEPYQLQKCCPLAEGMGRIPILWNNCEVNDYSDRV